jgi:TonB-linked SusC/RagA family outer membrane protein
MRKFLQLMLLTSITFLFTLQAYTQEKTVTGKVVDEKNQPMVGATVKVRGANRAVVTNATGLFSIRVNRGETLDISHIGYGISSVKIGDSNSISVSLKLGDATLGEVVVTAMDIKRSPRELGYSVQTVKGSDIQQTQRENFVSSLQGRVAGLTVTPTTGAAGASSGIILRGYNTLSGSNQPLFVVDGIILDNQTLNTNSYGGSGIGLASDGNNRNNDFTNRIADLNPNDIESVTVLKGPEATALYGSQASSGAIVITTKKAKGTGGKVLISYDNNFRMQKITRFAEINNDYGPGGSNGIPTAPPLLGQFTSFGPRWAANTTLYDNLHHFYRIGFSHTHSIGLEFGTKNVGFRVSGQYFNDRGVVPYNTYTKYNFKLSNNSKIGKYISINPSIAYINADNVKPLKGTTATGGYLMDLYAWPANNDIRNYEDVNGSKLILFNTNYNSDYDNPIWSAKNNTSGDKTEHWIANMGIDINPFSWLSLAGRFGYDTYKTDGYVFTHTQSFVLTAATGGSLDNYYRTYNGYNHTITATAKKTIKGFTGRLLVGTVWQDFETKQFGVYGTHITDSVHAGSLYKNGQVVTKFDPTDSSITLVSSRTRLLRNYFGLPNVKIFRELAYFGEVSLSFKNVAFLTYSHRFESASPIPAKNRNYNYPGASLSLIVSDIFPIIQKGNILNYFKLRGSLANTARLNDPYSNQSFFVNNNSSSSIPPYTYGFTNADENLKPERQQTYEVGAELRFFRSAVSMEVAYYNTLCLDQISQGYRASYATGFVLNTTNASSLRNQGLELTVNLTPVRKQDFNWTVNLNFNHMWSKVLKLPESIGILNDFYNSDTYISNVRGGLIRGHSTGTITGSVYQRNAAGQVLINPATGLALNTGASNFLIGDRTPDFTLGAVNTLKYKNWSLSFLWDLKVGGDIYNGTDQALTVLGKSARTADRNTPLIVEGVLNDGLQNTANPTKNTIVVTPYFLSAYYTTLPDEEFIQKDVNWLRLRDVTLNYVLPQNIVQRIKGLKGLSFFITGNDLLLITNYYGADPAVNSNNPGSVGVGGYGLDLGSAPTPLSLSFGLRANL